MRDVAPAGRGEGGQYPSDASMVRRLVRSNARLPSASSAAPCTLQKATPPPAYDEPSVSRELQHEVKSCLSS
jgi:hypothetical protein